MKKVLIAGATGQLGRHVVNELRRRGYATRALVRDPSRLNELKQLPGEFFIGDATQPATLRGVCDGVDVVFSSLGAPLTLARTRGGLTYRDVDYAANKNLLAEALRAGVGKFIYVSVFGAELMTDSPYVRAHEDFVRELKNSPINYTVIRPTGFFSAHTEIIEMARRGAVMLIGKGDKRTNPIHEEDLAVVCAEAIKAPQGEIAVGGPEAYTRRETVELAFAALGKTPKIYRMPVWAVSLMLKPLRLFDPRLYEMMSFLVAVMQRDVVAPPTGTRSLARFMREAAATASGEKSSS